MTEQIASPYVSGPDDGAGTACACWSRRESLKAAGVAVVGAAGLGACGSSTGDAPSGAASAAGGAIAAADVPVGGGKVFEDVKVVVTQPTEGDFKAFSAVCTHQGCLVESSSDGEIPCPCHLSRFSLDDGSPLSGPASAPLAPVEITVDGDSITQA
jgi:Rieske Fe-S protein